ncbi:MAG: sugar MFS transporter [Methylicorpusculum sp.]|uniref:sugar MFS transporter n=1 Tax=Methylicorpusculum sp. TaxID=2713644 RepID=UPI002721A60B|nr:sugar MFS transporter [Methylicorpusculum sp.]MDO8842962.1 sugar MFS transporter [Methylicorpusculum sp.]MDO8940154.1 sugar MFS transporter [Methylicorpusculum sp.]MDP2202191.1 sugar MFS transporter [Methylicorpusculum sp.]
MSLFTGLNKTSLHTDQNRATLTLLTSLFFIWGFITCLNDILIPHLKSLFTLSYTKVMLVQFCFFTAYFLVSMPSGYLVKRIGYKNAIVSGLAIAGFGCLLFYPAAALRLYWLFLSAFFVLASGITMLQVAANPYVSQLGSSETASSRLTLTQAFNSLGTTVAPYFGATFILSKTLITNSAVNPSAIASQRAIEAAAVQNPYLLISLILFTTALVCWLYKWPVLSRDQAPSTIERPLVTVKKERSVWQERHLILGAIAIFLYVGAEVSIGSFMVNFLSEPKIIGLPSHEAASYLSIYWGGAMIGRFLGAALMAKIKPNKVLVFHAVVAALLITVVIFGSGKVAMIAILSVGFCNSIMFPSIFSLGIKDLGGLTQQGSGILCAAIVGGAIIPVIQGLLADAFGIQHAFALACLCYLYIAYFGWSGHAVKT